MSPQIGLVHSIRRKAARVAPVAGGSRRPRCLEPVPARRVRGRKPQPGLAGGVFSVSAGVRGPRRRRPARGRA